MTMEMRRDKITVIAQKTVIDLLKLPDRALLETSRVDLPQHVSSQTIRDLIYTQIWGKKCK